MPQQNFSSLDELIEAATELNRVRYAISLGVSTKLSQSTLRVVDVLTPDHYLIVYGSLAPGQSNHHELSHLEGTWVKGHINGYVKQIGWGANLGYPGLSWDQNGPRVEASILHSTGLHQHWNKLDEFEGHEYNRMIIPFIADDNQTGLGHAYCLHDSTEK